MHSKVKKPFFVFTMRKAVILQLILPNTAGSDPLFEVLKSRCVSAHNTVIGVMSSTVIFVKKIGVK